MVEIAFIVLMKDSDSNKDRTYLEIKNLKLTVVAVTDYQNAIQIAKELYSKGITIIELCGGFGHIGTAEIVKAVPRAKIGVVRFDIHPSMDNKGGDSLFLGDEI